VSIVNDPHPALRNKLTRQASQLNRSVDDGAEQRRAQAAYGIA